MRAEQRSATVIVFDLGGTWFRWGVYDRTNGLQDCQRVAAINYISHPNLTAYDLQNALANFIIQRVQNLMASAQPAPSTIGISIGAPVNAHDMTVLGSGPLWGPTAKPFSLHKCLLEAMPNLHWQITNDVTALLASYMEPDASYRKTMLITVSSGIGSRLYDHRSRRIPFDAKHGIQGEIGHLVSPFELAGRVINRKCECGEWNHMNAFASGRGILQTLRDLPSLSANFAAAFPEDTRSWHAMSDERRWSAFVTQLECENEAVTELLDSVVTPVSRALAAALSFDPEIDRIIITGGVARGFGAHYQKALRRVFLRDGLYQITSRDSHYLDDRLHWDDTDDFAGLRGAGILAAAC